jgi:hypothetical protein
MKHVFLIHSNIAILMANSVIKHLGLGDDNIMFISARGVKTDLDIKTIKDNDFLTEFEKINLINFFKYNTLIDTIDQIFQKEISANYKLYIPHLANPFFQILATNENCKEIVILEEGINCLSKRLYQHSEGFKRKIIDFIFNYTGIYGKHRFYRISNNLDDRFLKNKIETLYAITPDAFSFYKKEAQVISPSIRGLKSGLSNIEDGSVILIFEGIVDQKNLNELTLFNSLDRILSDIKELNIKVKFHPAQSKDSRNKIIEKLSQEKRLEIIVDNTILEVVLLSKKNLKIYGFTSSLLHYGKICGHTVFSYAYLWDHDDLYKRYRSYNDFQIP